MFYSNGRSSEKYLGQPESVPFYANQILTRKIINISAVYLVLESVPVQSTNYGLLSILVSWKLDKIAVIAKSHDAAFTSTRGLARVLRFFHFCNHLLKGFRDVLVQPRASFGEGAFKLLGQFATLLGRHLPLLHLEVALIAHDDKRHPICPLTAGSASSSSGKTRQVTCQISIPDDSRSCRGGCGSCRKIAWKRLSRRACSHGYR